MDKVQHFEIPADDIERAKKFYGDVFSWKLTDVPGMDYTMIYTVEVDDKFMAKEPNVINGGMMKRTPEASTPIVTITVDSIEQSLAKLKAAGGTIVKDIQKVGDMGLYAYVKDTEGNTIGVWENIKKSKSA